jgi:hypothetical protein
LSLENQLAQTEIEGGVKSIARGAICDAEVDALRAARGRTRTMAQARGAEAANRYLAGIDDLAATLSRRIVDGNETWPARWESASWPWYAHPAGVRTSARLS